MIRLTVILIIFKLQAYCSKNGSKAPYIIPEKYEDILPFKEELVLNGGSPINWYFAACLIVSFPRRHDLVLILDVVDTCRKWPLPLEEVKLKCRRFKSTSMRKNCHSALVIFSNPDEPSFVQEEADRKSLKQRGFDIINEGDHAADLLFILNGIRSGGMKNEEVMYYIKRFQLYSKIPWKDMRLLVKAADRFILKEWHALNVEPKRDDSKLSKD